MNTSAYYQLAALLAGFGGQFGTPQQQAFSQMLLDSARGSIEAEAAKKEAKKAKKKGGIAGFLGGAGGGAGLGATLGSVIPGVGTLAGALVGGALGGAAGAFSPANSGVVPMLGYTNDLAQNFQMPSWAKQNAAAQAPAAAKQSYPAQANLQPYGPYRANASFGKDYNSALNFMSSNFGAPAILPLRQTTNRSYQMPDGGYVWEVPGGNLY